MKTTSFLGGVIVVCLLCFAFPVFAADGFGQYTTGGAGGTVVTVSSAGDFKTYVESTLPYIVQVSRTIDLASVGGIVHIQSNKTIRGIGTNPTVIGQLSFINDSSNIIIQGLNITNPSYNEGDGLTIRERITNLFITRCTIYDCSDGCLDITKGSDYITVSWCKFYYNSPAPAEGHRFVNLVGHDPGYFDDRGKLHVTFHHNWWSSRCMERMPRVRFGQVHVYNNYYSCTSNTYCAGVGNECQIRLENNCFDNVRKPWENYYENPGTPGKIGWNSGNQFINTTIPTWATNNYATIFTPSYSYTLDTAANVKSIVMAGAGAPVCYGDFDRSKSVNFSDLAQFAGYWLDTNDIDNADYYDDSIVNFREFALLAQNWKKTDFTAPSVPTGLTATAGNATVSLDWNNNGGGDLAGYNIYRSTTFGGGYAKLNVSLLSSPDHVDNTVTNGTLYYYVVTAADTSSNESGNSSQVSAIPLGAGSIIIQENTTGFCGVDGVIDTLFIGYTGSGYANTLVGIGSGVDWRISVSSSGTYTFRWRYSHVADDRTAKLLVNSSEVVPSISFPATGDGSIWSDGVSVDVSLTAGTKDIRLESTNSEGLANIDYLMVTGENSQPASCP